MKEKTNAGLSLWQDRLKEAETAHSNLAAEFDRREALFRGSRETRPCTEGDKEKNTYHVRNLVAELIEAEVDANIPKPKVVAKYKEDRPLAEMIENMLRNELERLRFTEINDMMERTVPIQGGCYLLVLWNQQAETHTTQGDVEVKVIHPKQVVPQPGIYTCPEDMDYFFIKLPQTKEYLRRRYGVDLSADSESEPEIRGENQSAAEDLVTQYLAYYRNESGGIGLFSWVDDTVLEDYEDYQCRNLYRCKDCNTPYAKGTKTCSLCGGKVALCAEERQKLWQSKVTAHGKRIPPESEAGAFPREIPYYRPNLYPLILQKSVSVFGQLLGDSDADKILDQQNTSNRLATKILDKLLKAGSFATLPADAMIRTDNEDMKYIRLENAADKSMIDVFDMEGSIDQDLAMYGAVYEEARNAIGITDSFLGRRDTTATSGRAKEFAAAQSAGRLESKRVMKNALYARLFELIFRFKLAYADEPRPVTGRDINGGLLYDTFDRFDFLAQDESGEYFWNDRFLFGCDTSASLAANREAMWQETRMNLEQGAFGDPRETDTLILFWTKMAELHYPGAEATKAYLMKKQREAALPSPTEQGVPQLPQPLENNAGR